MNRGIKYYLLAWGIAVVIFHAVMFLFPDTVLGTDDSAFWIIYVTIFISFIGQAVCSYIYAKKDKKEERFLYIPVVLISYIALLMTLLLALQAMTLRFLPDWFTIIVAILVVAYYAFGVLRTIAAAEMILDTSERVDNQTQVIYSLIARAKALQQVANEEILPFANKVYELFRYSDPMSSSVTASVDNELVMLFEKFSIAVQNGKKDTAEYAYKNIGVKIAERNELCKRK